jgi:hypothetical protein
MEVPQLAELDAMWADWLKDGTPEDANAMINTIGLGFGQRLVDDLGMRWVIATDSYGTEMAVHHPFQDTLLYPANLVAKRWESRQSGFLRPIYDDLAARLPG